MTRSGGRRPVESVDGVGLGRRVADEVDDEIRFHVEERTEELMRAGLTLEEARATALREFGPMAEAREALERRTRRRRVRKSRTALLEGLIHDLHFAARGIQRNRAFALVVATTVAIGIAGTTVAMSIAHGILMEAPPIPEPERMAAVWEFRTGDVSESMEGRLIRYERYRSYADASTEVFSGLAAHSYGHFSLGTPSGAVAAEGFLTSGNYFRVLGAEPIAGRLYGTDHEPAVVISERLWASRFGRETAAIGQPVHVNGRAFTLVGVAPAGFVGTMSTFTGDLFMPAVAYAAARPSGEDESDQANAAVRPTLVVPIGRLHEGLGWAQASSRVDEIARTIALEGGGRASVTGARLDGIRWRTDLLGYLHAGVGTLLGAAGMLLLIACANIAGLVLARAYDRRREVALRVAIGSGRGRVVRQMVTENLLLFSLGGLAGVALAWVASRAIAAVELPLNATITLDIAAGLPVMVLGLVVTLLLGVAFGFTPARQASSLDLSTALKEGGQPAGGGRQRHWFVVAQIGIASILLIVAGLATRSFVEVLKVDLGFDPEGVLVATLDVSSHGYDRERGDSLLRCPDRESAGRTGRGRGESG